MAFIVGTLIRHCITQAHENSKKVRALLETNEFVRNLKEKNKCANVQGKYVEHPKFLFFKIYESKLLRKNTPNEGIVVKYLMSPSKRDRHFKV